MITENGYSKDLSIIPEGIAVTFGKEMIAEHGGLKMFLRFFNDCMEDSDGERYWLHKCKNKPRYDILYVYVIILNRLYCRCYFGGYEKNKTFAYKANDDGEKIDWARIILAGPIEKPPCRRKLKGFQGFRYTTKLF